MKRLSLLSILILLIIVMTFSAATASSFDDIISQPDSEGADVEASYLEFDDFLADFQYYCKAWDGSFDTSKKQTKTLDDGRIVLQLDGVTFWIDVIDDRHEITQISVRLGDPKNDNKADYSMLVKADAMIATLEYKRPTTSAERSSILSSVLNDFQQHVEPAIKYASLAGSFPVTFYNSKYSYSVTYSEGESYALVVVISSKSKTENRNQNNEKTKETKEKKIPIEITAIEVGSRASFKVKNNMEETVTELYFRIRYYDKDGHIILSDEPNKTPVNSKISSLSMTISDGGLIKNQTVVVDATDILPFVIADRVDIAVSGYKKEDGITFEADELFLCWYSSDGGYPEKKSYGFGNSDYFAEWFAPGKKISLGITVDTCYPEYTDYYGVNESGFLIVTVHEGSIMDKKGVKPGDVLYACCDQKWYNNRTVLDRAKWELTEGKDVKFEFARGKETITIVVTPEDIKE